MSSVSTSQVQRNSAMCHSLSKQFHYVLLSFQDDYHIKITALPIQVRNISHTCCGFCKLIRSHCFAGKELLSAYMIEEPEKNQINLE